MKVENIKVGTKVMCSGYEGTVTKVCDWDTNILEVRLARGTIAVCRSTFTGQYENCFIIG